MKILLIYGGKSCEHDVSVITACLAKGYFDDQLFCCYLGKDNVARLVDVSETPQGHKKCCKRPEVLFPLGKGGVEIRRGALRKFVPIDLAVNCCHGVNGEDGSVAGLLNLCNIPQVESGVVASAVAMDKILTKAVFRGAGVPTVEGRAICRGEKALAAGFAEELGYPVVVKPSTLGSSIGISVAKNAAELQDALDVALCYDERVLVEKALTDFYEINCSAMTVGGEIATGQLESPVSAHEILTFEDKYVGGEKGFAPRSLEENEHEEEVRTTTKKIYRILGCRGVVRMDFLVDKQTGVVYANEINVVPGSLAYNLWRKDFSRKQFGDNLKKEALAANASEAALTRSFDSDVLSGGKMRK